MAALDTKRLNETFDILTHHYRRYVLYYLTKERTAVEIDALAAAIAKWDRDYAKAELRHGGNTVELVLRHTHLPKLADAGIITFGSNTDTIELGETEGLDVFLTDAAPIDGYAPVIADG